MITIEEQREKLGLLVHRKFIRTNEHVKGPYTTIDYVRVMLNAIFGPDNWSHQIMNGPEIVTVNDSHAYAQVTIRLTCQFANGQQVIHDDVGVWPLSAGRGATLENAKPERFETVIKAAVSDGLKACAEYLGVCFRPLSDLELQKHLRSKQAQEST